LEHARFELGSRHDEAGAAAASNARTDAPAAEIVTNAAARALDDHRGRYSVRSSTNGDSALALSLVSCSMGNVTAA
jgi:hypothetical protein